MSFTSVALAVAGAVPAAGDTYVPPSPADFWQPMFGTGAWAFTRPMAVSLVITLIVAVWVLVATRRAAAVPTKGQYYFEYVYNFVRNDVARDMIGSKNYRPFLPLILALFLFILFNNFAGVIPFLQNPPTARIGFPIALVAVVYLVYHYVGIKKHGLGGYFKAMIPAGLPGWIVPFIFLIEAITKFAVQPLTLTLRLFGNMLAGHMVLVLFILGGEFLLLHGDGILKAAGIASFAGGVLMTVFELLIQFLQAYVFVLLTASYIADSLSDEH